MTKRKKTLSSLLLCLLLLVAAAFPLNGCGSTPDDTYSVPEGSSATSPPVSPAPRHTEAVSEPLHTASLPCLHARHDPDSLLCADCGARCWHKYRDGVCIGCGKVLAFTSEKLDDSYYEALPEEQQGECRTVYISYAGTLINAMVYLPCGYETEERTYPVMVLLPTLNGSCQGAMTIEHYIDGRSFTMKSIYDAMFQKGDCEPVIIVTLDYVGDFSLLQNALREAVFPYLAENLRTFAKSGAPEDLRAARSGFALAGTSSGALHTCFSGLEHMPDLCANFAVLAGAIDHEEIAEALNGKYADWLPDMVFISYGENDRWAKRVTEPLARALAKDVQNFSPGHNLCLNVLPGMDHDWAAFSLEIYDALRVCFPYT